MRFVADSERFEAQLRMRTYNADPSRRPVIFSGCLYHCTGTDYTDPGHLARSFRSVKTLNSIPARPICKKGVRMTHRTMRDFLSSLEMLNGISSGYAVAGRT